MTCKGGRLTSPSPCSLVVTPHSAPAHSRATRGIRAAPPRWVPRYGQPHSTFWLNLRVPHLENGQNKTSPQGLVRLKGDTERDRAWQPGHNCCSGDGAASPPECRGRGLIPRLLSPSLLRGPFCRPAALRRTKSDTHLPSPALWSWKLVWAFKPSPTLLPPPRPRFTSVPFAVKEATAVPRPAILGREIQGNAGGVEMG